MQCNQWKSDIAFNCASTELLTKMISCNRLFCDRAVFLFLPSPQFAPSSPVACTPSLDSTTRSPWTPWPPSAALCTPPSSHPVTPQIMRCSSSSRCAPPSGVLSSACYLTTSGRSSSTSTTPTEVGDTVGFDSGRKAQITVWGHRKCFSDSE